MRLAIALLTVIGIFFLTTYLVMERRPDPDMNGLIPGVLALLFFGADGILVLIYALWRLFT